MNDTSFQKNSGRIATQRTFCVQDVSRECGVVTGIEYRIITLRRGPAGIEAVIDGQPALLRRAYFLLEAAGGQIELLDETPAVGNHKAAVAHRLIGRLGYLNHYALASEALGMVVKSLGALSPEDLQVVVAYAYGQHGLPTPVVAA